MPIRIRAANAEELPVLTDLAIQAKASHGYGSAFMYACREELTYRIQDFLCGEIWVYENENNDISGFCDICIKGNELEVNGLFIAPDEQRIGIGTCLWGLIEKRAQDIGVKAIFLDADPHAVAFYLSLGLEQIGYNPSGSINGRKLPLMRKFLSQS